MRNPSIIVNRQEQECDSARNLDKDKERSDAIQQINGENAVHEQLVKVRSEMSEKKTMMLAITEELQDLRLETKGLQKQLKHISTSDEKEYKLSERVLESLNVKSNSISEQRNDFTGMPDSHGEVDIK